jgi:membrane-associated protease RseP (regulator of RpoE activity)
VVPNSSAESLFSLPRPVVSAPRLLFHAFLFLLTLLTTTVSGALLAQSFRSGSPVDLDRSIMLFLDFQKHPWLLLDGLPFSITLLLILLAHEMGHYLTCLHYGIDASLPYFLPVPTLIGTVGAVIRIKSPIYTKRALFDVGIAGPLAGFALLLPALAVGVAKSKVIHGIATQGDIIFGTPLIIRFFEWAIFPGVASSDIYLHPIARAAWVGVLATALNLLPIGQLDGGHILYSFFSKWHKRLSRIFVGGLLLLAVGTMFRYEDVWAGVPWVVWSVALSIFALKHPSIYDASKLDRTRTRLAWLALMIFVLSFTLAPVRTP